MALERFQDLYLTVDAIVRKLQSYLRELRGLMCAVPSTPDSKRSKG